MNAIVMSAVNILTASMLQCKTHAVTVFIVIVIVIVSILLTVIGLSVITHEAA